MGVTFFTRWLAERYPLAFRQMDDVSKPRFDCFYIDFNAIIYFALSYYNPESEGNFESLITEIIRYLDTIIQIVRPTKLIYLSVDGTPPYAKCVRNRSSRLSGFMKNQKQDKSQIQFEIVAGSVFMEQLHQELLKTIENKVKTDIAWSTPKFIYSSYHVPGEAEHKITEFIRDSSMQNRFFNDYVHLVFSVDSDTIFLLLGLNMKYLVTMREAKNSNVNEKSSSSAFELIYVSIIQEYIMEELKSDRRIIDDFIALVFLCGNDFIPEFSELPSSPETFESILDCYIKTIKEKGLFLLNENRKFIFENLEMLFDKIMLNAAINGLTTSCASDNLKDHFPDEYKNQDFVNELLEQTLTNFEFVLSYYFGKTPSWSYYYPYEYSPPFSFLLNALKNHKETNFVLDKPLEPFEASLITFPREGKSGIPKELIALTLEENQNKISKYFPHKTISNSKELREIQFPPLSLFEEVYYETMKGIEDKECLVRNELLSDIVITDHGIEKEIKLAEFPEKTEIVNYPSLKGSDLVKGFTEDENPDFDKDDKPTGTVHIVHACLIKEESRDLSLFTEKINQIITIDWPYSKPAVLKSVCDGNFIYEYDENLKKTLKRKCDIEEEFPVEDIEMSYIITRGILLENTKYLLTVCPLKSASICDSCFTFSNTPIYVPSQIVTFENKIDTFTKQNERKPIVGERILVNNGDFKGEVAEITEVCDQSIKAKLIVSRDPFLKNVEKDEKGEKTKVTNSDWISINDLCTQFNMKPKIMRKAIANLPPKTIRGEGNNIEIHQKSLPKLMETIGVKHRNPDNKKKDDKGKKGDKGKKFEKKAKTNKMINYFVEVERKLMGLNIREIVADEFEISLENAIWKGKIQSEIPKFVEPGCRVIWIGSSNLVPFGAKGTVAEVNEDQFECLVISDIELPFGTTHANRLKTRRGFTAKFGDIYVLDSSV